jgi:OmpA-OmpF porin, OOP family
MANALYDLDVGMPWMYPYVGVGAGYQWTKLNGASFTQLGGPFAYSTSDHSSVFAWRAIAAASFPIPNMPGLSVTLDYRFMDVLGGEKFNGTETRAVGLTGPATLKLHNQYDHTIMVGVRHPFDTPSHPRQRPRRPARSSRRPRITRPACSTHGSR